jgi:ribokinase
MNVVVIGQIGRDLVLRTAGPPSASAVTTVLQREEVLGGKGANQAVGLVQLGVPVALTGVVGEDTAGVSVLQQAQRDGIDVGGVARRGATALLIDFVSRPPERMLLEDLPKARLFEWQTSTDAPHCGRAPTPSPFSCSSRPPRRWKRRVGRGGGDYEWSRMACRHPMFVTTSSGWWT